jgi:hypothetical protein
VSALTFIKAAACLSLALTAGCDASEEIGELPPQRTFSVSMDVLVNRDDNGLTIDYRFHNNEQASLVVFNGLPAVDGPGVRESDPNAVYVRELGDSAALVFKGVSSASRDASGPPFTLRGTVLSPGEEIGEKVSIPWPLTLRAADGDVGRRPSQPITEITFCLEFAPVSGVRSLPGGDAKHPVYAHGGSTGETFERCSSSNSAEWEPSVPATVRASN